MNTQAKHIVMADKVQSETQALNKIEARKKNEQDDLILLDQKRQLRTESLFGSSKEVGIVHGADEYMLRITKQGKLILTK